MPCSRPHHKNSQGVATSMPNSSRMACRSASARSSAAAAAAASAIERASSALRLESCDLDKLIADSGTLRSVAREMARSRRATTSDLVRVRSHPRTGA